MSTIAVFQPDSRARARLSDALASDHDLRPVDTWAALSRMALQAGTSACIVDLYTLGRSIPPEQLGRLRKRRPDLAIVVYSDFSRNRLDPFELGRLGIDAVVDAGDDDLDTIRDAVAQSLTFATAGSVATDLEGHLPALLVEALRWAIENAAGGPTAAELARGLGMSRTHLARQLRFFEAPPARALLVWGRLLHAAALLDRRATIEAAALASGYASGSGLHRAFRRHVGLPPSDAPVRGRVALVRDAFLECVKQKSHPTGTPAR